MNFNNYFIVGTTGPRNLHNAKDTYIQIQKTIKHLELGRALQLQNSTIQNNKPLAIMSGFAEGWDEIIAKVAIDLNYPLIAIVPNKSYGSYYWGKNSISGTNRIDEFHSLLAKAIYVEYVCNGIYGTINEKRLHANFVRNQRIVDIGNYFIAYDLKQNEKSNGTRDCTRRILASKKPYILI